MKKEYQEWIDAYREKHDNYLRSICMSASIDMAQEFPELEIVRGFVIDDIGIKHEHWWCKSKEDGEIIDPTSTQFRVITQYLPWKPGDLVRAGTCMNCGEPIYLSPPSLDEPPPDGVPCFCGDYCEQEYLRYLNSV